MAEIIHLRGAGRGVGGLAAMSGARRARLVPGSQIKRAGASGRGLRGGAWRTGALPEIVVECEGIDEVVRAIRGELVDQLLALHYLASSGHRLLRAQYATAIAVGRSPFPAGEGSGQTPLFAVTYALHGGPGITNLSEALTDGPDSGSPPTDDGRHMIELVAAYRGASGTTQIPSAVQAALECQFAVTRGRMTRPTSGVPLPVGVHATAALVQVAVELEDAGAYQAALAAGTTDEIVRLVYRRGGPDGTADLVCRIARLVDFGDAALADPESAGTYTRQELRWDLVEGSGVTSRADLLAIT